MNFTSIENESGQIYFRLDHVVAIMPYRETGSMLVMTGGAMIKFSGVSPSELLEKVSEKNSS
ncbi:hypothetical protein LCGC14_2255220 [marine sediment metagenome]|uniref:Uncharacterized protein n=1 Tax=marine sediment metagenome TaxID=412755 RepID=A0A0F9DNU0_9ZZZZ